MELYWTNLTLAMESGTVGEYPPSPLELAYQRCWIFTGDSSGRMEHEGICCQMDPLPEEDGRLIEDNDEMTVDIGLRFVLQDEEEEEEQEEQELENDDFNHGKSNIRKRAISDYGQLIG